MEFLHTLLRDSEAGTSDQRGLTQLKESTLYEDKLRRAGIAKEAPGINEFVIGDGLSFF